MNKNGFIWFYFIIYLKLKPSEIDFHTMRQNLKHTVTVRSFMLFRNCSFSAFLSKQLCKKQTFQELVHMKNIL